MKILKQIAVAVCLLRIGCLNLNTQEERANQLIDSADLAIVDYRFVMTPHEARNAGFFEHEGRWLQKRWRKKVKKWKRLDKSHSSWKKAQRLSSKHYRLVTNLPNHIVDAEIEPYLDAQYRAFTKFFKREFKMSAKAANKKQINIHKSIEDYAVNTGKSVQQARYNPGFIAGGAELTVYYDVRDPDVFFSTVMHEGAHQFISAIFSGASFPKWLNEGLATYFEGCSYSRADKKFEIGNLPMPRLATARRVLEERPNDSIDDLFLSVPDLKFGAQEYSLAWSFLHYLMHGENGKYKKTFIKFLKEMNGAGVKRTASQIFAKIAKVEFRELESGWKKFVLGLQTRDVPYWVQLRARSEELARFGFRAMDRVTHLDGIRVVNAKHFNELWSARDSAKVSNLILRSDNRENSMLRGLRLPANADMSLVGYNTRSRAGSLKD
ncbi:MAG: hypothetical protein ACI97A_000967 [Planctomycetota bacterium]|jgi:hypothetical protein